MTIRFSIWVAISTSKQKLDGECASFREF